MSRVAQMLTERVERCFAELRIMVDAERAIGADACYVDKGAVLETLRCIKGNAIEAEILLRALDRPEATPRAMAAALSGEEKILLCLIARGECEHHEAIMPRQLLNRQLARSEFRRASGRQLLCCTPLGRDVARLIEGAS